MSGTLHQRKTRQTTHLRDVPDQVTVIRKRHAFEGQTLAVISSIKRHGVLLVLVILPNGSRSLIPAAWTDWRNADASLSDDDIDDTSSLGKLSDLLQLGKVGSSFILPPGSWSLLKEFGLTGVRGAKPVAV